MMMMMMMSAAEAQRHRRDVKGRGVKEARFPARPASDTVITAVSNMCDTIFKKGSRRVKIKKKDRKKQ